MVDAVVVYGRLKEVRVGFEPALLLVYLVGRAGEG
jgi:hypothetical protein